jgi:hypothetical protein
VLLALLAAVVVWPTGAYAQDVEQLRQELEAHKERTAELENRINQLEARQKLKERSLKQKIDEVAEKAEAKETAAGLPDDLKWLERIKISGDLRYRYEYIDLEDRTTRNRNRIRARLMISAMVNDEWDVAFRMATGETDLIDDTLIADPVSTNQTLGKFSSRKDFWLDLAYFDYRPMAVEGLSVLGGKIKNPFHVVGKNQLMWDGDLNPEGVALKYARGLGESATVHVSSGGFWLNEESSGADTSLWGIQAYLKQEIGNPDYVLVGAGWYDYGNLEGLEDEFGIGFGNTIDAGTNAWVNDYDIVELFGEYGTKLASLPMSVFGTWVKNTAASTSGDTGWLVGTTLGKAKDPGSWQFGYDYRDVERDAVLAVWNDSDFAAGRTGAEGHVLRFGYQAFKNVQFALTYFCNELVDRAPEPDRNYQRFQADLKLKF